MSTSNRRLHARLLGFLSPSPSTPSVKALTFKAVCYCSNLQFLLKPNANMSASLLIFDFDHTLVDANTDLIPFETLAPDLLESLRLSSRTKPWTQLINDSLRLLADRSITPQQILSAVSQAPFPAETIAFLTENLKHHPMAIVSDANLMYIQCCLRANNLKSDMFQAGVHTNSAQIVDNALEISPYSTNRPHSCSDCPANLCKTAVVTQLITQYPEHRVVYVGDGGNDFCPCLNLTSRDVAMPRAGYSLRRKIDQHPIDASVVEWEDAGELVQRLEQVLEPPKLSFTEL